MAGRMDKDNNAGNFPQLMPNAGMIHPNAANMPEKKAPILFFVIVKVRKDTDNGARASAAWPISDMPLSIDTSEVAESQAVRL